MFVIPIDIKHISSKRKIFLVKSEIFHGEFFVQKLVFKIITYITPYTSIFPRDFFVIKQNKDLSSLNKTFHNLPETAM